MQFISSFLLTILGLSLTIGASPLPSGCPNTATFGNVFLSNAGLSLARGPLTMVLPEDSGYNLDVHRHRRHVVCGRTVKKAEAKVFEDRVVCPFHYIINKNEKRMPPVLEEVVCECTRPSHLSPYTDIRCQPVKYRLPVLIQDETGQYQPAHEELTLACIPVVPKSDEDFEMINLE